MKPRHNRIPTRTGIRTRRKPTRTRTRTRGPARWIPTWPDTRVARTRTGQGPDTQARNRICRPGNTGHTPAPHADMARTPKPDTPGIRTDTWTPGHEGHRHARHGAHNARNQTWPDSGRAGHNPVAPGPEPTWPRPRHRHEQTPTERNRTRPDMELTHPETEMDRTDTARTWKVNPDMEAQTCRRKPDTKPDMKETKHRLAVRKAQDTQARHGWRTRLVETGPWKPDAGSFSAAIMDTLPYKKKKKKRQFTLKSEIA
uniref:Uncharacterized protein n=1 Tax=Sphaerodactylus townsendi TaxID=933632 RepID=A0ACB8G1K3_9SAUR